MKGSRQESRDYHNYAHLRMHILSTHFSGIYLVNLDFMHIARVMGYDMGAKGVEYILGDLIKNAIEENRKEELYEHIASLFYSRLKEYERLKNLYPESSFMIEQWIGKTNTTLEYISSLLNDSVV